MAGIAETLSQSKRRGGTRLLVEQHLEAMPDDLREMAERLLASDLSDSHVAEGFTDEGDGRYKCGEAAVRNYRKANNLGPKAQP